MDCEDEHGSDNIYQYLILFSYTSQRPSKWASGSQTHNSMSATTLDDINTYLDSPPLPADVVRASGGILKYWNSMKIECPAVAAMALDFGSAPGKCLH
jgi:hypothetical protein